MKNQSDKPEDRAPQDSERKDIKHPEDDDKAVVKPEDQVYREEDANFPNPARERENSEQRRTPQGKQPGM